MSRSPPRTAARRPAGGSRRRRSRAAKTPVPDVEEGLQCAGGVGLLRAAADVPRHLQGDPGDEQVDQPERWRSRGGRPTRRLGCCRPHGPRWWRRWCPSAHLPTGADAAAACVRFRRLHPLRAGRGAPAPGRRRRRAPVTSSATALTSSGALPIATPRAAQCSISRSLRWSPTATVCIGSTPSRRRMASSAAPLETPSGLMSSQALQPTAYSTPCRPMLLDALDELLARARRVAQGEAGDRGGHQLLERHDPGVAVELAVGERRGHLEAHAELLHRDERRGEVLAQHQQRRAGVEGHRLEDLVARGRGRGRGAG